MTSAEPRSGGEAEGTGDGGAAPCSRPPWSEFRAALVGAGFRPSRRLGQNFLLDDAMAAAIARDAGLLPGEFVLEVGAGCGFLSAHLLSAGACLVAVEVDDRLLTVARGLLEPLVATDPSRLVLLEADALAGKHALAGDVLAHLPAEGEWSVVANLPYSIASPLLVLLSRLANPPRRMTVLVQAEVADRISAPPAHRSRGPLSAKLQALYRCRRLRAVSARLFWPIPRVESAVCALDLREGGPGGPTLQRLDRVVECAFGQRRKQLKSALAPLAQGPQAAVAWLESAGIDPARRAETLDRDELIVLADGWKSEFSPTGGPGGP